MSRDDRRGPRRDRRSSYRDDDRYRADPGPRKVRSGAVTALGIISLIAGPLELIAGLCTMAVFAIAPGEPVHVPGLPGIGGSSLISWLTVAIIFFWGTSAIAAGIGLLARGNWARVLCLMLGAFAGLVGMLYMMVVILLVSGFQVIASDDQTLYLVGDSVGSVFFLGYGIFSYVVLLHPARVEEFR